ncbi:MAG TPA: hypothetical protein VGP93_05155 [Polyangiaceae bacterium]|nr:hypothetical protein [Polyangiaceae bacterium]
MTSILRSITGFLALALGACSSANDPGPSGGTAAGGGAQAAGGSSSGAGGQSVAGAAATSGGGGGPAAGGSNSSAGAGGKAGSAGSGVVDVTSQCDSPVGPGLPVGAPTLVAGTWQDISPAGVAFGSGDAPVFTQGMAVDPCDPAVLYLTADSFDATQGGLFKSVDAGSTWARIATVVPNFTGVDHLDEPIRIRIDPKDTQHLYVGDGVRGGTSGFWVSTDGGANFEMPQSYIDLKTAPGIYVYDVYDVAVDPTDFSHVLVSFHSGWGGDYGDDAGILESTDGGGSWIVHPPDGWGGHGHAVHFLYQPELGLGDSSTWLVSTQDGTRHRTTDAGQTWSESTTGGIVHGGGTIYYTKTGVLYASGYPQNVRSTDNGATWTSIGNIASTAIFGDGTSLYSGAVFGPAPVITSLESDGTTWAAFNDQQFAQGPFEFAYDSLNRVLYNASWTAGLWALKPSD